MVAYIFNCDNETLNAELHKYIPVSAGLEAETIAPLAFVGIHAVRASAFG